MTRLFFLLLSLLSVATLPGKAQVMPPLPPAAVPKPTQPNVHSRYCVLMDAATGKVLWGRNENAHREMASTTKMMSALLLLERGHLDDIVTAPAGLSALPESSLHLEAGEKISLHDLLYAMLLPSDNDAAVAGADYLSGSVPAFVALMNQRAQELGCVNTHFVTPNGLYAPGHYSTPADLARIAAYALATQPTFDQIVATPLYKIHRSVHIHDVWMKNTSSHYLKTFPGADGVKTGYIRQAGHCFVGSATRNGWRLIAVALDSNSCREDVESILNFGFANFLPSVVVPNGANVGTVPVSAGAPPVPVRAAEEIRVALPKNKPRPRFQITVKPLPNPPPLPIRAGEVVGSVMVSVHGNTEATGTATAARSVAAPPAVGRVIAEKALRAGQVLLWGLGAAAGLALLLAAGGMIYGKTAKNARRRRRRLAANVRAMDSSRPSPRQR